MDREDLIAYSLFFNGEYSKIAEAVKNRMDIRKCDVTDAVTIFDDDYPKCLLDLKYPPYVLYYKGNIELLKQKAIGIVGSRKACDYALKATKALVLNKKKYVIVSGLAKGVDACAHKNAEKTIGVLGCGIDYIYPFENYELFKKIEKEGLIISEYPGLCKPYACHFPFRNRIIAALSQSLYIMQSSIRSGTMTSLNEALELGKEVRVLPYDIFAKEGIYNNHLIYEGATLIEADEIAF